VDVWALEQIQALPNTIVNSINGVASTNVFKVRMLQAFTRNDVKLAYEFSLVAGREASMGGTVPDPKPEPQP